MSKHKIRLPGFGDRVILAAGEDMHTGSKKLDELLERIRSGEEERLLTRAETGSLVDVRQFKRQPGQSEKREYYGLLTQAAVERYHELRAQNCSGREAIEMVIAEMAHVRVFTPKTIKNFVHRSRYWAAKRKQKK